MACSLFRAKSLSEPLFAYCQLDRIIKLYWNLDQNLIFFNEENASVNVACEMSAILSRFQCGKFACYFRKRVAGCNWYRWVCRSSDPINPFDPATGILRKNYVTIIAAGGLDHCFSRSLLRRHNGLDVVSNHQPRDCLLNRLFRRRSKKTSKLRVTGLCTGNSPMTGEFPAQRNRYTENVSIWWRHHVVSRNGIDFLRSTERCILREGFTRPASYQCP